MYAAEPVEQDNLKEDATQPDNMVQAGTSSQLGGVGLPHFDLTPIGNGI